MITKSLKCAGLMGKGTQKSDDIYGEKLPKGRTPWIAQGNNTTEMWSAFSHQDCNLSTFWRNHPGVTEEFFPQPKGPWPFHPGH